jgi:hypothetical protein
MGLEEIPSAELAWRYAYGQPLVKPEMISELPAQMRRLHDWYLQTCKEEREYLMVSVRQEHFYREDSIAIEMEELF